MENIPKELEETPLSLEVVMAPEAKCVTIIEIPPTVDVITDIIKKDPLQAQTEEEKPDISKMDELDLLIYTERQRILNSKELNKIAKSKAKDPKKSTSGEADSALTGIAICKFRARIVSIKKRLMERLKNFDNESYLKEVTKRNTERIRQKRMKQKEVETPEQREQRKSTVNTNNRLAKILRKAFKTPEELLVEREKRLVYLEKYWERQPDEERRARKKLLSEKSRERQKRKNSEWKKYENILKEKKEKKKRNRKKKN